MYNKRLKIIIKKKLIFKILVISKRLKSFFLSIYFKFRGFQILTSFSQQLEDIYIFNELIAPKKFPKNIYLIEVGALDGIIFSNTLLLEKIFQLNSILIEPEPNNYLKTLKNRPNSICLNCAISHKEELVKFLCGGAVGGISSKMSKKHKKLFSSNFGKEIEILALPLSKVLKDNAVEEIFLLSIDCEGGDLDVLKSIDFKEIIIHIIVVEVSHNKSEIEKLISSNGFYLHKNLFGNQIWVNINSNLIKEAVHSTIPIAWKTPFLHGDLIKQSKIICSNFKRKNILY